MKSSIDAFAMSTRLGLEYLLSECAILGGQEPGAKHLSVFDVGTLTWPVITTGGSGVTAAVLSFALASLGKTDVALYDGSWAEWGGHEHLPVATGKGA